MRISDIKDGDRFKVIKEIPVNMAYGGKSIIVNSILTVKVKLHTPDLGYHLENNFISYINSYNGEDLIGKNYIELINSYENVKSETLNTQEDSNLYCSCTKPELIKNNAGGEVFDFCKICKKEHKSDKKDTQGDGIFFSLNGLNEKEDGRIDALARAAQFHALDKYGK